jgi:hypothetical protein
MTRRNKPQSARSLRRAAARKERKHPTEYKAPPPFDPSRIRILSPEEVEAREYRDKIVTSARNLRDMNFVIPGQEDR